MKKGTGTIPPSVPAFKSDRDAVPAIVVSHLMGAIYPGETPTSTRILFSISPEGGIPVFMPGPAPRVQKQR